MIVRKMVVFPDMSKVISLNLENTGPSKQKGRIFLTIKDLSKGKNLFTKQYSQISSKIQKSFEKLRTKIKILIFVF